MQELKDEKQENIELTDFEVEQEESAIISYNELKKVSDELYDSNEEVGWRMILQPELEKKFATRSISSNISDL